MLSFQTKKMSCTTLVVRRRQDISPFRFQLIPPLVKMSTWIPVLNIFVNIHLSITSLRTSNVAPVMMSLVTVVKQTLLSTPTFESCYFTGGLFSLTLRCYFKLLLPFLCSQVTYSLSGFLFLGGTLYTYLPLFVVSRVPPVLLVVSITTPFTTTLLVELSSIKLCSSITKSHTSILHIT